MGCFKIEEIIDAEILGIRWKWEKRIYFTNKIE